MTGRELLAAVRPLESGAKAVLRFSELAHEAIRLEESLTLATAQLTETRAALTTAKASLAETQAEAAGLTATLDAQRHAAVAATETEQRAVIGAATAVVETHRRAAAEWAAKAQAAKAQHETTLATLRAEEAALRDSVDGLRRLAREMAKAGEAVLR